MPFVEELSGSMANVIVRMHLIEKRNYHAAEFCEGAIGKWNYKNFVPNAGNGLIHPIDKILIYNEYEKVGNILNERMRFDLASLQPELSSNNFWQSYIETQLEPTLK